MEDIKLNNVVLRFEITPTLRQRLSFLLRLKTMIQIKNPTFIFEGKLNKEIKWN